MSLLGKKACNFTFTGYGKVNEQIVTWTTSSNV